MRRSPTETALLVALLLKRSEKNENELAWRRLGAFSKRKKVRGSFIELLDQYLRLGVVLIELDRGGYAIIACSALERARPLTARRYLLSEREQLRQGKIDFDHSQAELEEDIAGDVEYDA